MNNVQPRNDDREFEFTNSDFRFISDFAYKHTGIVLAENKRDMVYSRLVRRIRALKLNSFAEYCALMQSDKAEAEMGNLVNAITTNLTSFFREGHHFEHLRDEVIKPFLRGESGDSLRLWSAACSAGMEPYSMAMTVKEAIKGTQNLDIKILATDIDTNMVATSQKGEYDIAEFNKVPEEYKQFFRAAKTKVNVTDNVKQLITFKQLNLLEGWPMKGQFDAVFCRNVVIYFDKPTKQQLFDRMADIIKPNGWLYIGHSENLHGMTDRFELLGRTIYRRIK